MKRIFSLRKIAFILGIVLMISCSKGDESVPITIFSVSDDISLGAEMDSQIMSTPGEYPVLDSATHTSAYNFLYSVRNTILASGKVKYATRFGWRFRIIKDDNVVNAFCVPGGNIYVYTGLIKLLDNSAQFAGVIAHEMAHADLRHTSEQLTLIYGETFLLNLILGSNPSQLANILADWAQGLGNLAYSRSNEYEADAYAVKYLYPTKYDAASLGDFFTKLESQSNVPVFLSTHPSPSDRLVKINETFQSLGGVHGQVYADEYLQFKNSLP